MAEALTVLAARLRLELSQTIVVDGVQVVEDVVGLFLRSHPQVRCLRVLWKRLVDFIDTNAAIATRIVILYIILVRRRQLCRRGQPSRQHHITRTCRRVSLRRTATAQRRQPPVLERRRGRVVVELRGVREHAWIHLFFAVHHLLHKVLSRLCRITARVDHVRRREDATDPNGLDVAGDYVIVLDAELHGVLLLERSWIGREF